MKFLFKKITKEISLNMPIILLAFGLFECLCNFITFNFGLISRL
jgi:hypothetical protein